LPTKGPGAGKAMFTPEGEEILVDESDMEAMEILAGNYDRVVVEREIFALAENDPKYAHLGDGIEKRENDDLFVDNTDFKRRFKFAYDNLVYPATVFTIYSFYNAYK
jgi:hypothetical protein